MAQEHDSSVDKGDGVGRAEPPAASTQLERQRLNEKLERGARALAQRNSSHFSETPPHDGFAAGSSNGGRNGNPSEVRDLDHQDEPVQTEPAEHDRSEEHAPEGRCRRWREWRWIAAALLAIFVIFIIYHLRSIAEQKSAAARANHVVPAAITVAESVTGNMPVYIDALGTVTPETTITLYSQITGQITAVHYVQGQIVHKSDLLIDIDPRPYQTTLEQAQGTLQRDQGVLAQARMDLKRYQAAFERNAIAEQQLQDQQQLVIQTEGTVTADKAAVAYDQVQLSYCHIVSPITGRVGLRLVDPGNTVFAGSSSTLVVVTQLQPITVVFNVSEDDLPQVEAQLHGGNTMQVDAFDRSFNTKIESGALTSLDNQVDTTTGTVKFRARFPNRDLKLYPNQFVNARLLLKTLRNVTLVPSAAVQHNGATAFVYLVQPGKTSTAPSTVTVQDVTVLNTNYEETAVQGLNTGVTVATSGFDRLENGVAVTYGPPLHSNNVGHGSNQSTGGSMSSSTAP